MTHVIHSINVTMNGSCAHEQAIADAEHHAYATALVTSAEAVLLGRNSFDLLEEYWPSVAERSDLPGYMVEFARAIRAVKKYVASSRPVQTTWANTTHLPGDIRNNISKLRAAHPGTIVIFGSPGLGNSLTIAGGVDELHVLFQPIAADHEPRLFRGLEAPLRFRLLEVESFESGVVLTRYVRI